jgi:hypothetical protein
MDWARRWAAAVGGRMGVADLLIRDSYHAPRANKKYRNRKQILLNHSYDPQEDIALNQDGCWAWNSDKSQMHAEVKRYFEERCEK